jgi:hypothetical protein
MNGCLLVATNAGGQTRRIAVKTAAPGDTAILPPIDPGDTADSLLGKTLKIFPNTVSLRKSKPIRIAGGDVSEVTIVTQDGKIMDRWNAAGKTGSAGGRTFVKNKDGSVEWNPSKRTKKAAPGVCFISASSTNINTGKKSTLRRKIMILP